MEKIVLAVVGVLLFYTQITNAYIRCSYHYCYGDDAYCCHLDDGSFGCCWDTNIYELWWFWLIWIIVFFLILACALACWRRRRARYRVMVMANSQYPGYGTVVHNNTGSTLRPDYSNPHASAPTLYSNTPVTPPSYETALATKPPPYSN